MNVALLSGSDSRKSGGLYNSVRCLADSLQKKHVNAQILAHHDKFSEQDLTAYQSNPPIAYTLKGPTNFGYSLDIHKLLKQQNPDLIHTQCIWMYLSKVSLDFYEKFQIPHIISPRGMLDPWAVRNSAWKKKLVAHLFENSHLRTAACLHALCQAEADAVRHYGLTNPIAIIPNGIDLPSENMDRKRYIPNWKSRVSPDKKVLLFLGRIHPKKGLVHLLEAWSMYKADIKDWCLVIAGWDENEHRSELEAIVNKKGLENQIIFVGSQLGTDKAATYLHADAFILPSLSEGLPMSVLEAWSFRLPVFMTPQCNLSEGFQAKAAIRFDPNSDSLGKALQVLQSLTQPQLAKLGNNGYQLVQERFTWEKIAIQMIKVYEWVLNKRERPDCVSLNTNHYETC